MNYWAKALELAERVPGGVATLFWLAVLGILWGLLGQPQIDKADERAQAAEDRAGSADTRALTAEAALLECAATDELVTACRAARDRAQSEAATERQKSEACYEARLQLAGVCGSIDALTDVLSGDE